MPSMSASGNISPQSRIMMRPSTSMQAQFRPISPSPPRKVILTGSAMQVVPDVEGSFFETGGGRPHRQAALPGGLAEGAHHGLGREGVGGQVAALEVVGLEQQ